MDNVTDFPGLTRHDIPVKRVLETALKEDLDEVLVIGIKNGGELFNASSTPEASRLLMLIELTKLRLLQMVTGGQ